MHNIRLLLSNIQWQYDDPHFMTSLDHNDLKRYQVPTSMSVKTVIIIRGLYSIWSCEILLNIQLESTIQTDSMFLKQCDV